MATAADNMFTRKHECGAVLDLEHVLSHMVGIQGGVHGEKALILFDCVCRSTIALWYKDAPEEIREAADQAEESRGLVVALG